MAGKVKPRVRHEKDEFNLEDVLDLGGTEDDFLMLKDFEKNCGPEKQETRETLQDDEFKSFFSSLGFDKIKQEIEEEDDPLTLNTTNAHDQTITTKKTEKEVTKRKKKKDFKDEVKNMQGNVEEPTKDGQKRDQNEDVVVARPLKKKNDLKNSRKKKLTQENETECNPLQDDQISSTTDMRVKGGSITKMQKEPQTKVFRKILELADRMPNKPVRKAAGTWYYNEIFKQPVTDQHEASDSLVSQLKNLAVKLLENDSELYKNEKNNSSSESNAWMKTVVSSGTLSDRVAAYTLMIQNAPVHNYWCLDAFINMLRKKGKREAIIGLDALRDVFLSELLPDSRKLRHFHSQPLDRLREVFKQGTGGASSKRAELQRYLIQWAYEDHLKSSYGQFVDSLRDFFLQDPLEAIKSKGMKVVLELLMSKPEREKELLTMLVNKLGDPKHKIASKSLHMLSCLIQKHPLMQAIVVKAVRDLLLRPNVQPKCQYYCICFLSAQILSHERREVADLLIHVYLGFFKAAVKKKQVDNKLLSAILTGVNRAYPYANKEDTKIVEELDILFRTVHVSSFGTAVQALMLLFQILSSWDDLSDRYFNALYSALLHPELPICTNRHPMFLNLLFRSLKADSSEARVKAFMKRLLQTCTLQLPPYTSAVLVLITELLRIRPALGCLFDGSRFDSARNTEQHNSISGGAFDEDSEEEHFKDVDEEEETKYDDHVSRKAGLEKSWMHFHKRSIHRSTTAYDPKHRNPTFSNAEYSSLWELHRIRSHYHPTITKFAVEVSAMAKQSKTGIVPDRYPGDPLEDFTLMRFLDKYVYRNPKARQQKAMSANTGDSAFRRTNKTTFAKANEVAANTPEFLAKKNYNPEELFLQRYFVSRAASTSSVQKAEKTPLDHGSDIEEVSDDEFENYLTSAEGQAELDRKYDFADGVMDSGGKKRKINVIEESEDDEMDENFDDEEVDFDMGVEEEENPFDQEGMGFEDIDEEREDGASSKRASTRKRAKKQKLSADVETFGMMLEENAQSRFDSSGSSAVRNSDRSSVKQLQWERKKETKDIVSRKRAQKRGGGYLNKGKRSRFLGKRNLKQKGFKFGKRQQQ